MFGRIFKSTVKLHYLALAEMNDFGMIANDNYDGIFVCARFFRR